MLPLFLTVPAGAQNYVRVESSADGRIYTVDLNTASVQRALRPVNDAVLGKKLPKWLYPGADFKASNLHWDPVSGVINGTFAMTGTADEVTALYDQLLRSHGMRVTRLPYKAGDGLQMTGSATAATVTVQIQPQSAAIQARVTYAPRNPTRERFDVVWYDDASGLLRVRDGAGDEYQMSKREIVANNLNKPGGVASSGAAMPQWLPAYPGASRSPKGRITWMFTPTAEFLTGDSIRKVYEFYLAKVQSAGATVKSSGINRSGTPLKDFDAYVIAVKGDDQVEIRIGELFQMGFPSASSGSRTGIGIRYAVPKR